MSNRKVYDQDSGFYGAAGEMAGIDLMKKFGFSVARLPNGTYGQDTQCMSKYECFYCEFERRSRASWSSDKQFFPYPTYNYLERRSKAKDSILVVFREDMKVAMVVFADDALNFPVKTVQNVHCTDEEVRQVPVERCLLIDVENVDYRKTFAMLNCERVRNAIESDSLSPLRKSRFLEPTCPYGMDSSEYLQLLQKTTEDSHQKIASHKPKVAKQTYQPMLFDLGRQAYE